MPEIDFEAIYLQYAKTVYRYLFALCRKADLAEKLTQDTFYKAILSSKRYNGNCKVSVWLCQIAKHLWYQHLRKTKMQPLPIENIAEPISTPLEIQYAQREDNKELYAMIHSLDEPYREVIYLRALANLSFGEIGEVMGKTETWSRVTFFRAKKQLLEKRCDNEIKL